MVVFNPLKREIDIKIVYYGPALCGKTTNIQSVHKVLNPTQRGELVSLATKDDRTLFFDFLPIELDSIQGFKTRFHIYTVPGQVLYTLTRRAVLTGVDGIIFVVDSQTDKMEENIESLNDLEGNLNYYKKDLESFPFVIQYNKRDLDPIIPVEAMEKELNPLGVPSFISSAINGKGVMETLTMCCRMVLKQIKDKSRTKKAAAVKEKDKEVVKKIVEEVISELPELTLTESHELQEDAASAQQSLQEEQAEQAAEAYGQAEETAEITLEEEAVEQVGQGRPEVVQEMDREEPVPEVHIEEPTAVHDLLEEKVGEQGLLMEGAQEEPKEEALKIDQEIKLEVPLPEVDVPEEEAVGALGDSLPEEAAARPGALDEEGKRACPRCSLKFKSNVKQCPICKISLIPEGEKELEAPLEETAKVEKLPLEEAPEAPEVTDIGDKEKGLEIIACGQPKKISPTAIKVPLIMKIDKTNQEFKVSLSINFEDFILKSKE